MKYVALFIAGLFRWALVLPKPFFNASDLFDGYFLKINGVRIDVCLELKLVLPVIHMIQQKIGKHLVYLSLAKRELVSDFPFCRFLFLTKVLLRF